jgi:hypothetical protein
MSSGKKFLGLLIGLLVILSGCVQSPRALPPINTPTNPSASTPPPPTPLSLAPTQPAPTLPPSSTKTPLATETAPAQPAANPVYGALARQYLLALSNTIGAREPGTPAEEKAAKYIQSTFEQIGYQVQNQPFSFIDTEQDEEIQSKNIIVIKKGSSPKEIIVGAHYDSGPEAKGADDNASGVAVLMETAKVIKDLPTPYSVRFIAFGAEEVDLNGSRYYVSQMSPAEIKNTVAMINLDSLAVGDINYIYGENGQGSLRDWILKLASTENLPLEGKTAKDLNNADGSPCDCADYGPFQTAGIPFAYFESTNWDIKTGNADDVGMIQVDQKFGEDGEIRHTEFDTIKYIDATFPGRLDQHLQFYVLILSKTLSQFTHP